MARPASIVLRDVAGNLRALPESSLITVARAVKDLAGDEARRVTGDGSMSRVGRRGARLRARDRITSSGPLATVRIQGVPVGPWVWATSGTTRHRIGRITRGRRLRGGDPRRALMAPGWPHPVTGPVSHPGARGRGAWRNVVHRAEAVVPAIFADEVHAAVADA